jgi:hypothetical protein
VRMLIINCHLIKAGKRHKDCNKKERKKVGWSRAVEEGTKKEMKEVNK